MATKIMDIKATLGRLHDMKVRDREIADKMGMTRAAVNALRNGRAKSPLWESGEKLKAFAASKGCLVFAS